MLASHRVYIADRKVEIARAQAETRLFEDQRAALSAQRETARLDSRTREADAAKDAAAMARSDALDAREATADAQAQTAELQRQIDAMNAKVTDRGLVLTLGDVLFASGRADLKPGTISHLDQLVAFLGKYPSRTVMIEGHTDSVGSDDYNQGLSQRRADSVRSYIVRQGVDAARVTTMGAGESTPVAGDGPESGRQQNRRVEVIIGHPALAARYEHRLEPARPGAARVHSFARGSPRRYVVGCSCTSSGRPRSTRKPPLPGRAGRGWRCRRDCTG